MDIKNIIDKWDPIDLFPCAPNDEYNVEIKLIESYIDENIKGLNQESLGVQIKAIFEKRFGADVFKKEIEDCIEIASEIIQRLNA